MQYDAGRAYSVGTLTSNDAGGVEDKKTRLRLSSSSAAKYEVVGWARFRSDPGSTGPPRLEPTVEGSTVSELPIASDIPSDIEPVTADIIREYRRMVAKDCGPQPQ